MGLKVNLVELHVLIKGHSNCLTNEYCYEALSQIRFKNVIVGDYL